VGWPAVVHVSRNPAPDYLEAFGVEDHIIPPQYAAALQIAQDILVKQVIKRITPF
jgi:hypothetical protein